MSYFGSKNLCIKNSVGIILTVIDEDYVIIYENPKVLKCYELSHVIAEAEQLGLPCLAFADIAGDTFYNEKQMLQIKKELAVLKKQPGNNLDIIKVLEESIDFGLTESLYYLKIEGE